MPLTATVVLCTRGRPEVLRESLPLLAGAAAGRADVLVVEQGGRLAAEPARALGFVHVVDAETGVSRARNLGAAAAGGEIVLFTDDDCLVPERWVADHLEVLADPGVAGSFGEVGGLPRHESDGHDPVRQVRHNRGGVAPWDVGHSSNMAIRRGVLLAVGGFDERIGPGARGVQAGEDADLIARLLAAGHVLASGTGDPVRHAEWRTTVQNEATLRAYERGAGVWIGAALRARRPHAAAHLRARWWLLRQRGARLVEEGRRRDAARLGAALAGGLVRGLALPPWVGQG